jgi:hypothetical protein
MSEMNPATASIRVAVECVTLWLESDRQSAGKYIAHLLHDPDGPGADTMIAGLVSLSQYLVLLLAKERGASADDLVETARGILQGLSWRLPE